MYEQVMEVLQAGTALSPAWKSAISARSPVLAPTCRGASSTPTALVYWASSVAMSC
ncbi:hypothetical protein ACR6C2_37530 [Streptomyces sp. INA 01156]